MLIESEGANRFSVADGTRCPTLIKGAEATVDMNLQVRGDLMSG